MSRTFDRVLPRSRCLSLTTPAHAQDFPNRPMTMVVPFAAGGAVDVLGAHRSPRAPRKFSASRS